MMNNITRSGSIRTLLFGILKPLGIHFSYYYGTIDKYIRRRNNR